MRVQRRLAGVPKSVAQARQFAIEALIDLPEDAVNDVAVMVSELATNALVHAATSFAVTIDRRPHQVYVEVTDAGAGIPTRRSPGEMEPHGRGLTIVEELSDQWGTIHAAGEVGKSVWFTLTVPLEAETSDAPTAERGLVPDVSSPAAAAAPAAAADNRSGLDALEAPSAPGSMPPIRDRIGQLLSRPHPSRIPV
jgi:anti-sigma regulatory factor (Ser/Thr protein kinase)